MDEVVRLITERGVKAQVCVVAYLTNRLQRGLEGSPHQEVVSDAIITGSAR
jgi:hypothetical protein